MPHGIVIIKNNISETSAFEFGYIRAKYPELPIFYAFDKSIPNNNLSIKKISNTNFYYFNDPYDLKKELFNWIEEINESPIIICESSARSKTGAASMPRDAFTSVDTNVGKTKIQNNTNQIRAYTTKTNTLAACFVSAIFTNANRMPKANKFLVPHTILQW